MFKTRISWLAGVMLSAVVATSPASAVLIGDCNLDGSVVINELQRGGGLCGNW